MFWNILQKQQQQKQHLIGQKESSWHILKYKPFSINKNNVTWADHYNCTIETVSIHINISLALIAKILRTYRDIWLSYSTARILIWFNLLFFWPTSRKTEDWIRYIQVFWQFWQFEYDQSKRNIRSYTSNNSSWINIWAIFQIQSCVIQLSWFCIMNACSYSVNL